MFDVIKRLEDKELSMSVSLSLALILNAPSVSLFVSRTFGLTKENDITRVTRTLSSLQLLAYFMIKLFLLSKSGMQ